MKKLLLTLTLMLSFSAFAQFNPNEIQAISPDANAKITEVGSQKNLMMLWYGLPENSIIKKDTNCYDRAHSWSYILKNNFNVDSKKIIIHLSLIHI